MGILPIARNRVHTEAEPEQVFAVLAAPGRYADWVVGAAELIDADEDFPAPGSPFRIGSGSAADVRDRAALGAAVDRAVETLGGIDVLVPAAAGASWGPFVETDPEDFDATLATVLGGVADTIRAALPDASASKAPAGPSGSEPAARSIPLKSGWGRRAETICWIDAVQALAHRPPADRRDAGAGREAPPRRSVRGDHRGREPRRWVR